MVCLNCKGLPSDLPFFQNEIHRMTELNAPELENCDEIVQVVQKNKFNQREYHLVLFYEAEKKISVVKLPYISH